MTAMSAPSSSTNKRGALTTRKNANAPLLPVGTAASDAAASKPDLRLHLAKQRAARAQKEQEESTAKSFVSPKAEKARKKKTKKKPLASFLPDYESNSPSAAPEESSVAPPVQSTSRMSRSMREDLGIASPPPVKAAKKEPTADSPYGDALLLKKVAFQQRRKQIEAEEEAPAAASPFGEALLLKKVAFQQERRAAAFASSTAAPALGTPSVDASDVVLEAVVPPLSSDVQNCFTAGETETATEKETAAVAVAAETTVEASAEEEPEAEHKEMHFEASQQSWTGGRCASAVLTPAASSAASSVTGLALGAACMLGLSLLALPLLAVVVSGARGSSRSTARAA